MSGVTYAIISNYHDQEEVNHRGNIMEGGGVGLNETYRYGPAQHPSSRDQSSPV